MDSLRIDSFFNLDSFAHSSLWKKEHFVWTPLISLKEYMNKQRLGQIEIEIPPGVYLKNPEKITIGRGTIIEPGTFIEGPCIIGENCEIRHAAYLRGFVILGNNCRVGHCAEIKHSIVLDEAKVTHFCYVGDSIIGAKANLGAGVKCANLRLDKGEIFVNSIPTGLRKFGAIIGDSVQIGCNCVLNPGTLVGKEVIYHPLSSISGIVFPGSRIKNV